MSSWVGRAAGRSLCRLGALGLRGLGRSGLAARAEVAAGPSIVSLTARRGAHVKEHWKDPKPRLDKAGVNAAVLKTLTAFDRFPKDHLDSRLSRPGPSSAQRRGYCGPQPNTIETVEQRVILVMQLFDKIKNPDQISLETHILKDLGLDSLDHVEIIMAMEDEFEIEIPDGDAERLLTPKDIAQYICDHDDIYE